MTRERSPRGPTASPEGTTYVDHGGAGSSRRSQVVLAVLAKAPVPGRVKTRLCPPCSPTEAALLARAALEDTLEAVLRTTGTRPVVVLDGEAGDWLPPGVPVVAQRAGDLAERLQGALDDLGGPVIVVGMDTPQLTPVLLAGAADALLAPGVDAVLGPAADGGYWSIGVRGPCPDLFAGVPMSVDTTARDQRARMRSLGLHWTELTQLRDVDGIADAREVALATPGSRFARALHGFHHLEHGRAT
jgi:hypothetical protein